MKHQLLPLSFLLASLLPAPPSRAIPIVASKPCFWIDDEYDRYKKRGDDFFAQGEYERAKAQYKNCLEVPGFAQDVYANNRIALSDRLLTLRKQADALLSQRNGASDVVQQTKGEEAMETYRQILAVNPTDPITKGFISDYWSAEGNKLYGQKKYVEAKARYEEALKYAQRKDFLQIQIQNSERFIQLETPPVKPVDTLSKRAEIVPPVQKGKKVKPEIRVGSYKPLIGLKIAVAVVGIAAGAQAFLSRRQIANKLNDVNALSSTVDPDGDGVILTPTLYDQWIKAYNEAKDAKAKESMVTVYTGVAVAAVLAEAALLILRPSRASQSKGVSLHSAPAGVGLSVRYSF